MPRRGREAAPKGLVLTRRKIGVVDHTIKTGANQDLLPLLAHGGGHFENTMW